VGRASTIPGQAAWKRRQDLHTKIGRAIGELLSFVISREVILAEDSTNPSGAPAGKYVVMRFMSSFEKKRSAVETVTFMLDSDGKWRAVRYFVK